MEENEKKVTPVRIFGSDKVLTEPEDIAYYRAGLEEFGAVNKLLGEIDDDGEYFISEDIRKNLAQLPKELLREDDDTIDATSRIMAKDMYFTIELDQDGDMQVASLYLTEMVHGYGELTSIRTFVAKYELPTIAGFGQKAKSAFNVQPIISDIPEGQYIDLVMRIQDQIDYALCLEDIVDLASQIYVLRVLALLESKGEKGQEIIKQYNREVKDKGLNKPSVRHRYATLRKILDAKIENAGGEKEIFADKQQEIKDIKKEFAQTIQKVEAIHGKNLAGAIKEAQKAKNEPQKKAAEAPKKAKKAGKVISVGVGKAKGGSKPKAKKKEDKKDNKKKENKGGGGGGSGSAKPRVQEAPEAPILKDEVGEAAARPSPQVQRPQVIERHDAAPKPVAPNQEEAEAVSLLFVPPKERNLGEEAGITNEGMGIAPQPPQIPQDTMQAQQPPPDRSSNIENT